MLLSVMVLAALPPVRARAHNAFELTHRFGGWTAVGLFWALTMHLMHADEVLAARPDAVIWDS